MEAGGACTKCGMRLDCKGIHPQSCMAGGDASAQQNAVRDVYEDHCRRGGLHPESEAPGLLRDEAANANSMERPADVLVLPSLALARQLPNGSRAVRTERICFDFAVVNALGPDHWSRTAIASGNAAEEYDSSKRRRSNIEERCRAQGLTFYPTAGRSVKGCGYCNKGHWPFLNARGAKPFPSAARSMNV